MENFIDKFVGQSIVDFVEGESLYMKFNGGGYVAIHNKAHQSSCIGQTLKKGLKLRNVYRDGNHVIMDFRIIKISFADDLPDTCAPEIVEVTYPDGRSFIHRGDE